jgi:hypothetical protein
MKAYPILALIVAIASLVIVATIWCLQPYFAQRDKAANEAFAQKAEQANLIGKSRIEAIKVFGAPRQVQSNAETVTLVLEPGPRLRIWRSRCKIAVDAKTGRVLGWQIGSD